MLVRWRAIGADEVWVEGGWLCRSFVNLWAFLSVCIAMGRGAFIVVFMNETARHLHLRRLLAPLQSDILMSSRDYVKLCTGFMSLSSR